MTKPLLLNRGRRGFIQPHRRKNCSGARCARTGSLSAGAAFRNLFAGIGGDQDGRVVACNGLRQHAVPFLDIALAEDLVG